jgi:hypothetical protein
MAECVPLTSKGDLTMTECAPLTDPFDPAKLRLSQDFAAELGVKKALTTVPVRKPDKTWFVRVHPAENYRLSAAAVLELKEERELYIVNPDICPELALETAVAPRALFTAINRQGVVFIWPVRLPGSDGKIDDWSRSAMEAAQLAMKGWVRIQANMALGAYEIMQATASLTEPTWPQESFAELLKVAFRDKLIDSLKHPVLCKLRGEV